MGQEKHIRLSEEAQMETQHIFPGEKKVKQITLKFNCLKKIVGGTSLVAQWLRIRLPIQGTWVRSLVQEDPTCHGAPKPLRHNY